ncbi:MULTISPECIES: hypothetical protein [unclassified Arcicella]|uniref:hypothetical protein n=1 Tax=unclassified Arcicella TaxID=2644986 RepID=UPI00285A10F3|nr:MULTISPECIES: hypothetical protein [unclassified Arcicella]MDR6560021.1 hypothetical protein [Arcicella sp. BE51]MDR6810372.1 hypothetical protein [Arcicella sp. BE140]MDR6821722.1 hypothetical protein [Arcicella sp. BE139]
MAKIEIIKNLALLEEFDTSNKLIRIGLGELQNIKSGERFYFLTFQLLSQGFERFMKAYICLGYFKKNGILPDYKYLKNLGHDLELLLQEILDNFFSEFRTVQYQVDRDFLTNDKDLKELFFLLSEFGKISRYYNFDIITNNNKKGVDIMERWKSYEYEIMIRKNISFEKILSSDFSHEVTQEITSHIIIVFEKFLASLARQFIFNNMGDIAKRLVLNSFFDYGLLYEKNIGKTDYRKATTKYKETPLKVHKRTLLDKLNRRFNSEYKSKRILKSEYLEEWPFYCDEVIIECRYKHWCIITIEGKDYSLNGSAKGRYKLENPHDAGMAILGKTISDFTKMALNL